MGVPIDPDTDIRGKQGIGFIESGNVRLHTDRIAFHSGQQMVHGRIACHTHAVDMVRIKPAGSAHLLNHRIDGLFDYRILKLFTSFRFHRLNDTVDHICAITDLSITGRCFSDDFSGFHIDQQG